MYARLLHIFRSIIRLRMGSEITVFAYLRKVFAHVSFITRVHVESKCAVVAYVRKVFAQVSFHNSLTHGI